ncbi:MAG TPA: class I SAM-dependent methyltransferase [Candidatus Paceibacterota bacterium]|nr:class I SAM-dependent methyltransferase [Candidatus Paceibacterota bacterium]
MSTLTLFPKRIPEPKGLNDLEMEAFQRLATMNSKRWFLPLVDDFLKRTKLKKALIVDVACGPGFLSKELASRNPYFSIIGIDISEVALKMARVNTSGIKNVDLKKASVYKLPFKTTSVDAVICKDSLHHFNNPASAIREMFRIIKPGGYLYIQDIRRDLPGYLISRSIERKNSIEKLQFYSTRAAYTKGEVRILLKRLGIKPLLLHTAKVTNRLARYYNSQGIDTKQLREGFQARYNFIARK